MVVDFWFFEIRKRDISFLVWVESDYDPADVKARFMAQWSGNPISELLKRE